MRSVLSFKKNFKEGSQLSTYKIISNGNFIQPDVVEIVADKLDDVENLPKDVGIGSNCIVLEDSSVWMLGNDKEWHKV